MATGTRLVLEVKKNKLNNSFQWFKNHKKTVVFVDYGFFIFSKNASQDLDLLVIIYILN